MFEGVLSAVVDEEAYLTLPPALASGFRERYGPELFLTSMDGRTLLLFPLQVFADLQARLASGAAQEKFSLRDRLLFPLLRFGLQQRMTADGRVPFLAERTLAGQAVELRWENSRIVIRPANV